MPDQSEVADALAAAVADMLYPAEGPAVEAVCRVFRGSVVAPALEADLAAGAVQLAVSPVDGTWRDASRFGDEWQVLRHGAPGVSVSVAGETVRFGGVPGPGDAVGVRVDGAAFTHRVRDGEDAAAVAATVAALVRAVRPAVLSGTEVALPGGRGLLARAARDGAGGRELRRQVQSFRVAVHAPGFAPRDAVAGLVERGFAAVQFLPVGGWACRVLPGGGATTDDGAAGAWRRDVLLSVEWPTTVEADLAAMLFGVSGLNAGETVG